MPDNKIQMDDECDYILLRCDCIQFAVQSKIANAHPSDIISAAKAYEEYILGPVPEGVKNV
jgi:hypothetical protein